MNFLCRIGIHIQKYLTADVAGSASCSCGKKKTSPVSWPPIFQKFPSTVPDVPLVSGALQPAKANKTMTRQLTILYVANSLEKLADIVTKDYPATARIMREHSQDLKSVI